MASKIEAWGGGDGGVRHQKCACRCLAFGAGRDVAMPTGVEVGPTGGSLLGPDDFTCLKKSIPGWRNR